MTIPELIALLKAPERHFPDRLLDSYLDCILRPHRMTHAKLPHGYTMEPTKTAAGNFNRAVSKFISAARGPAPHYTGSIDAAVLLIPEDGDSQTGRWDWQLEQTNGGLTISARVGPQKEVSFADTPAVALCIAALKARLENGA